MRNGFFVMVLLVGVWCSACPAAESKKGVSTDSPGTQIQTPQTADEQAIRQSVEKYVAAFNKGDAKAMGLLWTANGEYVDETGRVFRGRDAVEKRYEAFFAANKGLKIQISISSVKFIGGNAAIEDGTGIVKNATGTVVSQGSYTAIHLKEGDNWLIASVREHAAPSLSNRPGLKDLEWLIGDWVAAKDSKTLEFSFRWIVEKQFLELAYTARDKGNLTRSGIQIVGRDPLSGDVISWSFDSTGGHGRGHWKLLKRGVMIDSRGTMADGAPTAATEILSKTDADGFTWKSVNRRVAGQGLPDTATIAMKRKPK
jgi:uncharacterized protein (TIGR02246 family)